MYFRLSRAEMDFSSSERDGLFEFFDFPTEYLLDLSGLTDLVATGFGGFPVFFGAFLFVFIASRI
jgi:hypothetical protein